MEPGGNDALDRYVMHKRVRETREANEARARTKFEVAVVVEAVAGHTDGLCSRS